MVSYLFSGRSQKHVLCVFLFLSHHSFLFQSETASLSFFFCTQVGEKRKMNACAKLSPIWDKRCSGIKWLTILDDSKVMSGKWEKLLKDSVTEILCIAILLWVWLPKPWMSEPWMSKPLRDFSHIARWDVFFHFPVGIREMWFMWFHNVAASIVDGVSERVQLRGQSSAVWESGNV